jgi:hypothetical protein
VTKSCLDMAKLTAIKIVLVERDDDRFPIETMPARAGHAGHVGCDSGYRILFCILSALSTAVVVVWL